MDYELNFNKRETRIARNLKGFIVKRRLTGEEMVVPNRLQHWFLDDAWKGHAVDDILKAFDAAGPHHDRRMTTPKRSEEDISRQAFALAELVIHNPELAMEAACIAERNHARAIVNCLLVVEKDDPNFYDGAQIVTRRLIDSFDLRF